MAKGREAETPIGTSFRRVFKSLDECLRNDPGLANYKPYMIREVKASGVVADEFDRVEETNGETPQETVGYVFGLNSGDAIRVYAEAKLSLDASPIKQSVVNTWLRKQLMAANKK